MINTTNLIRLQKKAEKHQSANEEYKREAKKIVSKKLNPEQEKKELKQLAKRLKDKCRS